MYILSLIYQNVEYQNLKKLRQIIASITRHKIISEKLSLYIFIKKSINKIKIVLYTKTL